MPTQEEFYTEHEIHCYMHGHVFFFFTNPFVTDLLYLVCMAKISIFK